MREWQFFSSLSIDHAGLRHRLPSIACQIGGQFHERGRHVRLLSHVYILVVLTMMSLSLLLGLPKPGTFKELTPKCDRVTLRPARALT